MLIRATNRVLDRVGGITATHDDRSTTRLGDWYLNALFGKQVALSVINDPVIGASLVEIKDERSPRTPLRRRASSYVAEISVS